MPTSMLGAPVRRMPLTRPSPRDDLAAAVGGRVDDLVSDPGPEVLRQLRAENHTGGIGGGEHLALGDRFEIGQGGEILGLRVEGDEARTVALAGGAHHELAGYALHGAGDIGVA